MQWWSSASTSRTSTLCLLKNFPPAQQAAEVRRCLPGAEVKVSPCLWHPGSGIPSCVPSIASHLLVFTGLGCHFKPWHKLRWSMLYHCLVRFCHPPATACLHPVPLRLPPQPEQPIQQPRNSAVGTTQKWQLLSALAGLVQRSLVGKFFYGNWAFLLNRCKSYKQ